MNRDHRPSYLEIRNLRVVFDRFVAVDGVDLRVDQGDLRFLIGPNGAGKTTTIDAVTALAPAQGSINHNGHELVGRKTHKIVRYGVGRTFQTASVFEDLTVVQNLDIAAGLRRRMRDMVRSRRGVSPRIQEVLEAIGLTDHQETKAGVLSHGQKQWLEIGMLIVQDATVLLLDEPVAGMSQDERDATGDLLAALAERHVVIVVEHDMEFLRKYAQSVTVMAAGKIVAEGTVAEVQASPLVQEIYLGAAGTKSLEEARVDAQLVGLDPDAVTADSAPEGAKN
ncbi:urea ABC transporter ATP-binding protein UrtD [Kocuria sp. JC486]|uniref:Urea ABC transporter ATP-binding protein UrtD n=1 Tax=Kocuria soli TaxID=2485125 RepID=A0A3N3ZM71_9MICC|nr:MULTISPECIES: urea ABC transporter ATP-binding protein UrtD [Kocuria]NHU86091.1 urea ABC transporter ATP-binding protein UrtD [Kocuria sp. JC486]ROZ61737.1 urea ABC transporter ATP-binding protein UrtD [Kocuria soli]